jgi:hypothetical protein
VVIVLVLAGLKLAQRPTPNPNLLLASTEKVSAPRSAEVLGSVGVLGSTHALSEAQQGDQVQPVTRPTIARELRAVAVLFAVLCVLPWLAGAVFGS